MTHDPSLITSIFEHTMENNADIIDTAVSAEPKSREIRTDSLVKMYSKRRSSTMVSITVHQSEIVGTFRPERCGENHDVLYDRRHDPLHRRKNLFIDNMDISKKPMYKRARMGIGYLPQEASIFRKVTVADNVFGGS